MHVIHDVNGTVIWPGNAKDMLKLKNKKIFSVRNDAKCYFDIPTKFLIKANWVHIFAEKTQITFVNEIIFAWGWPQPTGME